MTHVLRVLTENGLEGVGTAVQVLLNEAMKLERSEFLRAGPYERSDERQGHANGFKPKTLSLRAQRLYRSQNWL
jgi:hypothetical protein